MSTPINDGGPVFPVPLDAPYHSGMSMREYFAAHATDEDVTLFRDSYGLFEWPNEARLQLDVVQAKYRYADAMIAEGNKPQ